MYGKKSKNITDIAEPSDWIVGTGGVKKVSAGHGKIIYVMRVDEKITLARYHSDPRFKGRSDNLNRDRNNTNRHALISKHYFYFGKNAINITKIPRRYLHHPLEKKGPRYRADFDPKFIKGLTTWLERKFHIGMHGDPCGIDEDIMKIRLKCKTNKVHKKISSRNSTTKKSRTCRFT